MTEQTMAKTFSKTATTTMNVARWHEAAYVDIDGDGTQMGDDVYIPTRGLTTSETDYTYSGEIEGTGVVGRAINQISQIAQATLQGVEGTVTTLGQLTRLSTELNESMRKFKVN